MALDAANLYISYSRCSIAKGAAFSLDLPIADVQNDNKTQDTKKIAASQAVNFFRTSAVEVPNTDSLASPPNEEPRPELLLS